MMVSERWIPFESQYEGMLLRAYEARLHIREGAMLQLLPAADGEVVDP